MNNGDIVKRLRDYDNCHDGDVDEAADEIERLRKRVEELESGIDGMKEGAAVRIADLEQELAAMKKQWNDLDARTERHHLEWTVKLLGLQGLLRELIDPDPCSYDHHGYCQAHSLGEKPCPHERAKALLEGMDAK